MAPDAAVPMITMRAALAALAFAALAGCDLGAVTGAPPATCSEVGVQCSLGGGPLGVCERRQCAADESAPCFQCTPQH